ncbi:hypothetical protein XPA_008018 [Xanthoria parietina]
MHYFTHLLLFALSPLTILAQPSHRAQTALAEENPVVQALDKAASEYLEAYELADKLPASCVFAVQECTDKLVRTLPNMIVPSLLVPPLTWRANANQKVIPVHITRANEQLDIAAENFVPKVPCASIDAAFLKLRDRIEDFNAMLGSFAVSYKKSDVMSTVAMDFYDPISDQLSKVDEIAELFAGNFACNTPQSPRQLRAFASKVTEVKRSDDFLAMRLKEVAKKPTSPPRQSGDNLEVTVSFHGADSDGEL